MHAYQRQWHLDQLNMSYVCADRLQKQARGIFMLFMVITPRCPCRLDVRDAAADASKFAGLLTNVNTFRDHASTWNVNLTGEQQDAMEMLQV